MKPIDPPETSPALGKPLPRARGGPPAPEPVWRPVAGHPGYLTDGQNIKLRDDLLDKLLRS